MRLYLVIFIQVYIHLFFFFKKISFIFSYYYYCPQIVDKKTFKKNVSQYGRISCSLRVNWWPEIKFMSLPCCHFHIFKYLGFGIL